MSHAETIQVRVVAIEQVTPQIKHFKLAALDGSRLPAFSGGSHIVVVMNDVTDFVRLDEMRSELIGVASHELKTPLTTLRMSLLLLREGADSFGARQQEMLTASIAACASSFS